MKTPTYFAAFLASCLFFGQATGLAVTRQDALVGWWNFDDSTSNDSSGNDYHGVHSSPSIYSADSPFGEGKGIDLVGNQHVTVSDNGNESTFDGGTQFTLSFWLKFWGFFEVRGCFAASANRTFHIARSVLLCKKLKPIA